jgi:hypothetical protein
MFKKKNVIKKKNTERMFFLLEDKKTKIKFVFSHITKNGGSTIRGCIDPKVCQVSMFNLIEKSTKIQAQWKYAFSFAIIRDPTTRFLSAFSDFKDNRKHNISIDSVIKTLTKFDYQKGKNDNASIEHHLIQQTHNIWSASQMTHLIRYENFKMDLTKMFGNYNISIDPSKILNNRPSKSNEYLKKLTGYHLRILEKFYYDDYKRFNYKISRSQLYNTYKMIILLVIMLLVLYLVYTKNIRLLLKK